MKLLISVIGVAALASSTLALADNPNVNQRGSMARATQRVSINVAKNPEAPGLPNALGRLADNAVKHQDNGPQRVERPERPERALPPSVADRPTPVAFRDRPLPAALADRPLPPGHTRGR